MESVHNDNKQVRYSGDYEMLGDPNLVELRLSTDRDIMLFERFLRGEEVRKVTDPDDPSKTKEIIFERGHPLANEHGVNQIVSLFSKVANPNVVQANFWDQRNYHSYIYEIDTSFLGDLIVKAPEWGIETNNIGLIHDQFLFYVIPYMTRAFQNKEREHLSGGLRPAEYVTGEGRQREEGRKGWFGRN